MSYKRVIDTEWVEPIRRGYRMICCDCGLVHRMDFRLTGDKHKVIQFRVKRDNRATAAVRRVRAPRNNSLTGREPATGEAYRAGVGSALNHPSGDQP